MTTTSCRVRFSANNEETPLLAYPRVPTHSQGQASSRTGRWPICDRTRRRASDSLFQCSACEDRVEAPHVSSRKRQCLGKNAATQATGQWVLIKATNYGARIRDHGSQDIGRCTTNRRYLRLHDAIQQLPRIHLAWSSVACERNLIHNFICVRLCLLIAACSSCTGTLSSPVLTVHT